MPALYTTLQIRPKSIIAYETYEHTSKRTKKAEYTTTPHTERNTDKTHDITQENNTTKGHLSPNSIRKLRYAINLLSEISPFIAVINEKTKTPYNYKLGFLTLTLPCLQQGISDETIKRKCLMPFIMALEKKFGKFSYVWKAEAQKNGNIHFHLTINKYINYSILRAYWNRRLGAIGMIDEYRHNMQSFHSEGFRVREDLLPTWPLESQKKAYEFGCISNWSQPNTTDIHNVRNINNLAAYCIKYMSKAEEDKRPIKGKIWGCSSNLTYNNKFLLIEQGITLKDNQSVYNIFKEIKQDCTAVRIFYRDPSIWEYYMPENIISDYKEWIHHLYHFPMDTC